MKIQNDIKLLLNHEIFLELLNCVENVFPNEACGLIFGNILEIPNEQQEEDYHYHYFSRIFRCIPPDKSSTVSFLIENEELLHEIISKETLNNVTSNDSRLLSIFHSHPNSSFPSKIDMYQMKYLHHFSSINHDYGNKAFKNLIWLIMDASNNEINGFIYFEEEFQQIKILKSEK